MQIRSLRLCLLILHFPRVFPSYDLPCVPVSRLSTPGARGKRRMTGLWAELCEYTSSRQRSLGRRVSPPNSCTVRASLKSCICRQKVFHNGHLNVFQWTEFERRTRTVSALDPPHTHPVRAGDSPENCFLKDGQVRKLWTRNLVSQQNWVLKMCAHHACRWIQSRKHQMQFVLYHSYTSHLKVFLPFFAVFDHGKTETFEAGESFLQGRDVTLNLAQR